MNDLKKICFVMVLLSLMGAVAFAQETGSVKGKVRNEDGKRIPGVNVAIRKDGKNLKSTRTNKDGKFLLRGIKPGTYNLAFEKQGYSLGVLKNVLIKSKKTNNLRDRLILTVDDGTLVIIQGSVFNQYGRSIRGAKIKIEEIRSNKKKPKTVGKGYTSRSGEFIFRFPEGAKKLRVTASANGITESKDVKVDEVAIYRLAITLKLPEKGN